MSEQRDELAAVIESVDIFRERGEKRPWPLRKADAVIAEGWTKPRTVTTAEELDALPVGSVVLAHWVDGSQPDYQMTHCPEGAASAGGGFGVGGGAHWLNMASWGATLTVLWEPAQ